MSAIDGPFFVYIITNEVTRKNYVGCTSNIKARFENHKFALKGHRHPMKMMQADYDACGADSFRYSVFAECPDKWEASRIETFMMKILKSQNPEYGYNYKDRKGNSPLAIADRWRTEPRNWADNSRAQYYIRHGILLPPRYV